MFTLSVALILASALAAADPSPAELVALLASRDRVVRDEAARTLEELGVEALPRLQALLDMAKPPEIRERLSDVIARLEARALDRPTMVVLDFDDRPLGEAVEAVAARSGFSVVLDDPALAERRVTSKASAPLPFWAAVDRLGRDGHVRHDPGPRRDQRGNEPQASTILLVDGDPPISTAYSGPLRIHVFASHRHRDVSFETTEPDTTPRKGPSVTVEIQTFAEPGRFLNPRGQARLVAVDGKGRAISPQPRGETDPGEPAWIIPGRISLLQWQVPLGLPNLPAGSPLKLRGVLPVVITSRRPDPLVIPLADASGKTFRQGPSFVRVESVSTNEAGHVEATLRLGESSSPPDRSRVSTTGPQADHITDFPRDRIEFEDAEGHPLTWAFSDDVFATTARGEIQIRAIVDGAAPPARLRIYRLHRLATEIPFELVDVPSP